MNTRLGKAAVLAALSSVLLSAGAHAQATSDTGTMPMAGSTTPPTVSATLNDTDKLFMLRAAQGDMGEIKTSQMALKKSKDDSVKQLAQTLISGHSQSLKEGMGLGVLLGLPAPKDAGATNMAIASQLNSAGGKDFDKKFTANQVEAHENTIALYNMEIAQGQDPQVKAFAMKYLPGIEGHTQMIYQVAKTVMAPDADLRPASPPTVPGYAPSMVPVSADTPATATSAMPALSGMGSGGSTPTGATGQ